MKLINPRKNNSLTSTYTLVYIHVCLLYVQMKEVEQLYLIIFVCVKYKYNTLNIQMNINIFFYQKTLKNTNLWTFATFTSDVVKVGWIKIKMWNRIHNSFRFTIFREFGCVISNCTPNNVVLGISYVVESYLLTSWIRTVFYL